MDLSHQDGGQGTLILSCSPEVGAVPFFYQWAKSIDDGATWIYVGFKDKYTLSDDTSSEAGHYKCEVNSNQYYGGAIVEVKDNQGKYAVSRVESSVSKSSQESVDVEIAVEVGALMTPGRAEGGEAGNSNAGTIGAAVLGVLGCVATVAAITMGVLYKKSSSKAKSLHVVQLHGKMSQIFICSPL